MIFKLLVGFIFLSGAPSDGWFPVEKKPRPAEQNEVDPSIWVLFSKNMGDETFLVRLPGEPSYRYTSEGHFELFSEKEGRVFQLIIEENGRERGDLLYQLEGKWVHEHTVKSGTHLYCFRTLSNTSDNPDHEAFISSFFIEKIGTFF